MPSQIETIIFIPLKVPAFKCDNCDMPPVAYMGEDFQKGAMWAVPTFCPFCGERFDDEKDG